MKFFVRQILLIILLLSQQHIIFAQVVSAKAYDANLNLDYKYSYNRIQAFAKNKNTYDFMAMGYFLSANNNMYTKTGNIKYLQYNLSVIQQVLLNNSAYSNNLWVMNVDKKNGNSVINGQASLVFEGYFFRYVGEFYDIIKSNNLFKQNQIDILSSLKKSFDKWDVRSERGYGDQSRLFHERFHIAANWAVVALYLNKYFADDRYNKFCSDFDRELRKSLNTVYKGKQPCYIWNSTYPDKFTAMLKKIKVYPVEIQDVSHGNHVVNYVLTSYNMNRGIWTKSDLQRFSNTIKYIVWNSNLLSFSDNVDGTNASGSSFANTGWKQSDGWMKLIKYDSDLKSIYSKFYNKNRVMVNESSLGLQFISNL